MLELYFTENILKRVMVWGFLFPAKIRYSLGYKPLKYKKQIFMCWPGQHSQWSLQTSRAESQGCMKLPQNWVLCSLSSPPWGSFLSKYFFIVFKSVCFFHFPLPSLAWSGEHPVLGGRGLLGSRLCAWLFHQVGSSFWRQNELTGAEKAPGMLPSPWFHRVPSSIPCCTEGLDCSSYILNQQHHHHLHWASLQEERGFNSI